MALEKLRIPLNLKATVKLTGEKVEVYRESNLDRPYNVFKESLLNDGRTWSEFELEFDESETLAEAKDCGLLNIAADEPVIIKKDLNEFEEQIEWLLKKYSVYADDFKGRQDVVDFIKAYAPQVMATAKRIIAQNIIHSIDNEDY